MKEDIAIAIEDGKIDEKYGKQKYSRVDKKYSELYILFEQRLAKQHQKFIAVF